MMSTSDFDFERMLHPIDSSTFLTQYWEKRPCLVSRSERDYYSELLSTKDVDSIIQAHGSDLGNTRLVKEG
ncbi:hypothetical protein, partial [Nostoc piscinale]